jgi:trehalose-6-phosphate synthase
MSAPPLGVDHGPLVVVSNRLPYDLPRRGGLRATKRNVGGLVNAVEPVLSAIGGAWVGWDGASLSSAAAVADALGHPNVSRTPAGVEIRGAPLSEREIALYYHGFSNRGIWPGRPYSSRRPRASTSE